MEEFPQPVLHPASPTTAHKIAPSSLPPDTEIDGRAARSLASLLLCSSARTALWLILCSGLSR